MSVRRRQTSSLVACEKGAIAIEFALIAPVLLLLVLGIMGYGVYFGISQSIQDAAGQAARAAVAGIDMDERSRLARDTAQRSVASNPLLSTTNLAIAAAVDPSNPNRFVVTLTYDLSKTVVAAIPDFVPLPKTVARTASIQRGGL